jgi:hypothetical protein
MTSKRASRSNPPPPELARGYWAAARRPLHVLVFLAPLIVAYELCLALLLRTEGRDQVNTVEAHRGLMDFFAACGVARTDGLLLGGMLIIVILLVWHVLTRERWRVQPSTIALMAVESLLLTIPLLVVSRLMTTSSLLAAGLGPSAPGGGEAGLSLWSQLALSVGAGLYEELIFRMLIIAIVHTLLVDAAKLPHAVGALIAVMISAAAFTWYHDLTGSDGAIVLVRVAFFGFAGVYFGVVFLLRGFGIVVGVHALYDVLTVLLPAGNAGP